MGLKCQTRKSNLVLVMMSEAVAQRHSIKKVFLEISQNSQENTCARIFFNKVEKKRLQHRCFLANFTKFLRTPFLQNTSGGCWNVMDLLPFDYIRIWSFFGFCLRFSIKYFFSKRCDQTALKFLFSYFFVRPEKVL